MEILKKNIQEWEELLQFLQRTETPFRNFNFIIEEIERLKHIQASIEASERKYLHNQIISN